MVRRPVLDFFCFVCVIAGFGSSGQASAQSPAQAAAPAAQSVAAAADPAMPKDANAAMLLAARVNGLSGADMKPWHLKASYQTFDADGKPKDQGTFEEWWAGPGKYKFSYTSKGFNQVEYRNGEKNLQTGDAGLAPFREAMVEEYLVHPLPNEAEIDKWKYIAKARKIGRAVLMCAEPLPPTKGQFAPMLTYCFDQQTPVIRLEQSSDDFFVLFNSTFRVGNHYSAKQILVGDSNLSIVRVDVTTLEFLPKIEEATVTAPALATNDPAIRVKSWMIAGSRISGENVHYPWQARQDRVQGLVMLEATITQAGDISSLEVVSGPKELRQSAFDAVKTWKYKPYLLNGQPVEVETQVNVVFTLGG
ncbi:MAG TPA: energy transducer TonB [Bryobacteraceae bacterium]|jgi:TonB family protein